MSAAALAALAGGEPRLARPTSRLKQPKPTADTCILLWMAGGMAAPETFDPKRYTPFEVGVPAEKILSTFPAIDTAVDNIKISQGLENIAKVMDRATLIRSHVVADLGNILHSRHQYHWHTGYVPPQTVAAPHIGSWIARCAARTTRPSRRSSTSASGSKDIGESEELKAFTPAASSAASTARSTCRIPLDAMAAVRPPKGMTAERFESRQKHYQRLVQAQPARRAGQRLSPGVDAAGDRQRPSAAQLAGPRRLRPDQGAEGELRQIQHRPLRPGLPAGPAADRGREPASSR